jgi:hypothetical protein
MSVGVGNWILVKYATKKILKHFIGKILEKTEDGWLVKFTKFTKNKCMWPQIEDVDNVADADVLRRLPEPTVARRSDFIFEIGLTDLNL